MDAPIGQVLTVGEVARALAASESSVRRWADEGALPYFQTPGGHRRFRKTDVEAFMTLIHSGKAAS